MSNWSYRSYESPALIELLGSLTCGDFAANAQLVAVVAEVDRRQLYRGKGYDSMYAYCVRHLGMSDDVAFMRIRVGRLSRRLPVILDLLADGRLRLSGLIRLVPHLTRANAQELLATASGLTNREIRVLVAERFPKPDVKTELRSLSGEGTPPTAATATAASAIQVGAPTDATSPAALFQTTTSELGSNPVVPSNPADSAPLMEPLPPRARVEPLAKGRYAFQLTVDQDFHDLLRYAQALLGHAVPSGAELDVLNRALRSLVDQLERRMFGVGARLRSVKDPKDPRYTSPADRCEVFVRDEGACTWVSDDGHRCGARTRLRFHHKIPFARGGDNSAANLTLHCAPHDRLEAERAYGVGFMQGKVEAARQKRGKRGKSASGAKPVVTGSEAAHVLAAARNARSRGRSPAEVLGSRSAAAEAMGELDRLLNSAE